MSKSETTREREVGICITCGKRGGLCKWTDNAEVCMRKQLVALRQVFDLAHQWVEANEAGDRPNRNEAEAYLPEAVKQAQEALNV